MSLWSNIQFECEKAEETFSEQNIPFEFHQCYTSHLILLRKFRVQWQSLDILHFWTPSIPTKIISRSVREDVLYLSSRNTYSSSHFGKHMPLSRGCMGSVRWFSASERDHIVVCSVLATGSWLWQTVKCNTYLTLWEYNKGRRSLYMVCFCSREDKNVITNVLSNILISYIS